GNVLRPQIVFKFKLDGTDVVFPDPGTAGDLIPSFVGSPSAYFVFALPQDGKTAPADFNASASAYIRNIWNGTGTCSNAAATTTQPLTQIDLPAYPYVANEKADGVTPGYGGVGGLIVPPPDVSKVATGFTGRRAIVDNSKCGSCHVSLGVGPDFHAGQRNDAG